MPHTENVIVVGAGLAGLSAAHQILQKSPTIKVFVLEKMKSTGGNSIKASSGINGAGTPQQEKASIHDTPSLFYEDTRKSAKQLGDESLAKTLSEKSANAVKWLEQSFGIDLSVVSMLGGHSVARTHRGGGKIPPGFAIMKALGDKLGTYPNCQLITEAKVLNLITKEHAGPIGKKVIGVNYLKDNKEESLFGNVILATGGYSASDQLVNKYRPDLSGLPTTNSDGTLGEGLEMCQAVNAELIDADQIQVHPTGFVDPKDPSNKSKFLAGEALRGEGGILLIAGKRFTDELQTRDYVTGKVMQSCEQAKVSPGSVIALNPAGYEKIKHHVDFYVFKGLMKKGTLTEMCTELNWDIDVVKAEFESYNKIAEGQETDPKGRKHFGPGKFPTTNDGELFWGLTTPVLHFTMGGVHINSSAQVLGAGGSPIEGLYAAGEVSGGVHGANRLGGSSLLECVVFGRIAADSSTGSGSSL